MRIATFNVENLFERAKAFNEKESEAQSILAKTAQLNALLQRADYTSKKTEIVKLLKELGLNKSDQGNGPVLLRQIRGKLLKRSGGKVTITAAGQNDWIGWVEAKTEPINEIAIDNTGRVIRDVNADILAVIEADNRIALDRFSSDVLKRIRPKGKPYHHVMLIDGNDDRGIDVGPLTRKDFPIVDIRTHIYDVGANGRTIFSRDCPEYAVDTEDFGRIWVLPNHFKSKFGGDSPSSKKKRTAQSERTAKIVKALLDAGEKHVVVLGDLNDTPDSAALKPLLGSGLIDVSTRDDFDPGQYLAPFQPKDNGTGTYALGNDNNKIDYLLLSPALNKRVTACGLFRKGAWPGKKPKRWDTYPELTHEVHVASDHHVIWADLT